MLLLPIKQEMRAGGGCWLRLRQRELACVDDTLAVRRHQERWRPVLSEPPDGQQGEHAVRRNLAPGAACRAGWRRCRELTCKLVTSKLEARSAG